MKEIRDVVLLKKVTIIDPNSKYHKKKLDILIEKGTIKEIANSIKEPFGAEVIDRKNAHCSPGWFDMHVNVQDPGYEYKEDIDSALEAASSGGFTGILSCSTTIPPIDNKSSVQYQIKKSQGQVCDLFVSGAVSKGNEGKELAELYDMHLAGAKAFTDFKSNIDNSQLLNLAMQYIKPFNGLLMIQPNETYLSAGTVMNEGLVSTENGLKGLPSIAEEMGVQRALKLLDYTEHRLHFNALSTKESVDLVKKAKQQGKRITTGVNAINLLLTDEVLIKFDSNFKLNPPLRDERARKALIKGIISGTIDVIVSDHWPQNVENKDCEFEQAAFGMSSIESNYAIINTALKDEIEEEVLVGILAINPREILGIDIPVIEKGQKANMSIYQPDEKYTFNLEKSKSKSRNSSMSQYDLKGYVIGTINNDAYYLN